MNNWYYCKVYCIKVKLLGWFDRRQENRTSPWHQAGKEEQGGGTLEEGSCCWLHMCCPPCCLLLVALKEYVVVFLI